jgi:tryptophan synthase alpha chain
VSATTSTDRDPLAASFAAWRAAGRRALIPYLTAGYPDPRGIGVLLDAYAAAGADIIELGVPFSDPVADGPTIQRASLAALEGGTTLGGVLAALAAFRARSEVPVVLFSYLNPILSYGLDRFVSDASAAGATGVLVTDLPVGSDAGLEEGLEAAPISLIRLIAPTTPPHRVEAIAARAQGFLYYIARLGVTGAREALREELGAEIDALRKLTNVPIAVGFGISTAAHAATAAAAADGVVVGSALIDALDTGGVAGAAALLREMRTAIDGVQATGAERG